MLAGNRHPIRIDGDPRSKKLFGLARANDSYGPHCWLADAITNASSEHFGKKVPLNAEDAIEAVAVDMGYPPVVAKIMALMARTAGLGAHLKEGKRRPIAKTI